MLDSLENYNIILANGEFPATDEFVNLIKNAKSKIACDGATKHLLQHNIEPTIIIGDGDSLAEDMFIKFHDKILKITDQNSNDLSKAVNWAHTNKLDNIIILGATGLREDHTIANVGLMVEYMTKFKSISMLSPYGIFTAHIGKNLVQTIPGQQISFFATQNNTQISAPNLKWPLKDYILNSWHCGTLNEATSNTLSIKSSNYIILYRSFDIKTTNTNS